MGSGADKNQGGVTAGGAKASADNYGQAQIPKKKSGAMIIDVRVSSDNNKAEPSINLKESIHESSSRLSGTIKKVTEKDSHRLNTLEKE